MNLFKSAALALTLLVPLAFAAKGDFGFLMPGSPAEALRGLSVSNETGETQVLTPFYAVLEKCRATGLKLGPPSQAPAGNSPYPRGFLLEVSGLILEEESLGFFGNPASNGFSVGTASEGAQRMVSSALSAGRCSGERGVAIGFVLGGQGGSTLGGSIILIGE